MLNGHRGALSESRRSPGFWNKVAPAAGDKYTAGCGRRVPPRENAPVSCAASQSTHAAMRAGPADSVIMAASRLPEFAKPPVTEVILGIQFDVLAGFTNGH